jgi:aconitate hydratase
LQVVLHHANGSSEVIEVNHSYNEQQIEWFGAGGALYHSAAVCLMLPQ